MAVALEEGQVLRHCTKEQGERPFNGIVCASCGTPNPAFSSVADSPTHPIVWSVRDDRRVSQAR